MLGKLICRNVTVNGRRTSMRLEPDLWDALDDISRREKRPVSNLVSEIDARIKGDQPGSGPGRRSDGAAAVVTLTASVRVFIASYYRAAATEEGHREVGHGGSSPFAGTPFDLDASASATETRQTPMRRGLAPVARPVPA